MKQEEVSDSEVHDLYSGALTLDLSANINYSSQIESYKVNGVAVEGSSYTVSGNFTDTASEVVLTVTAVSENGKEIEYIYKVKVKDTSSYRVANGGFDDGLDGWTMDGEIGEISASKTFWENLPMFNDGNYFRGESKEGNVGTLTSPEFKIGGTGKISFALGAGNGCFVTLESSAGEVLAVWRNYKFEDVGGWDPDKIGTEQFALNLVTYVADLTQWQGETVRIVINDCATEKIGFVTFDSLVTYYADEEELPKGYTALNELADVTALTEKIAEAEAIEQGDYTDESYAHLGEKIAEAKELAGKKGVTQSEIDGALNAITVAVNSLALRVPSETDAEKVIVLKSGAEATVDVLKYVDENGLSLTYELSTESGKLSVDGLKITASDVEEDSDETVTLTVKYKGEPKLTIVLTVKLTSGDKPVVNKPEVVQDIDIFTLTDKNKIKIDFAQNVSNPANLTLIFTVNADGNSEELTLDADNCYEYNFDGSYSDEAVEVTFNVTVGSEENALTVIYTYKLVIKDTTAYRVVNGDFETGDYTGWTYTVAEDSSDFGIVVKADKYFNGNSFNTQNNYLFTGIETNPSNGIYEAGKGTLKSSNFILKQNGWISFLMGGAHNIDVGVRVRTATDNTILAEFNNRGKGFEGAMDRYIYKFTGMNSDTECYIEVFDNASGDWGCIAVDDFRTYFGDTVPEGKEIVPYFTKGQIKNGGFDTGDLSGWTIQTEGMTGGIINADTYWGEKLPFNNNGYFLSGFDTGIAEADSWSVRSSAFTLSGSGYISVRMGGNAAALKIFKADGTLIGTYKPNHFSDANFPFEGDGEGKGSWACMRTYFIDLSGHIGEELYLELHDTGSGAWANAFFDEVITYYGTAPDIENGFDTVTAPVGREEEEIIYGEVQLKWRIAVKAE